MANDETVHYFHAEEELGNFGSANPDLRLFGEDETDTAVVEKAKNGNTRRADTWNCTKAKPSEELLVKLARKGLNVEHYSAQDKPLFELIEGEGRTRQVKPLFLHCGNPDRREGSRQTRLDHQAIQRALAK